MNTAILLFDNEANRMSLSFHYYSPLLTREFIFDRPLSESLGSFNNKIKFNVMKALLKEPRGDKNKPLANSSLIIKFQENAKDIFEGIKLNDLKKLSNLTLFVDPVLYKISINPPYIKSLKLPSLSAVNMMLYPKNLKLIFSDITSTEFNWYISGKIRTRRKLKWHLVSSGYFYTPNINALGCKVRLECIPRIDGKKGPARSIISKECVSTGPDYFPFQKRHSMCESTSADCFRLVTYNSLASLYADTPYSKTVCYPYIPSYALCLDYRMQLIIQELLGYQADIICLQEVDKNAFYEDLKPVFELQGYDGILSLKKCYFSSCSKTNSHNYKEIYEGIACFFNTTKFSLKATFDRHLFQELQSNPQLTSQWEKVSQNSVIRNKLSLRKNVLQVNILECRHDPAKLLIIGNTHLYYHPEGYVQLIQAAVCLTLLNQYQTEYKQMFPGKEIIVLFCGDFNSTPTTDAYKYITQKCYTEYASMRTDSRNMVEGLKFGNPFSFLSAYGTPAYTNYTNDFVGCLDYIFFPDEYLLLKQVIPLPSLEEVSEHDALPSIVFPSDHLALIADFAFK